MRFYSITLPMDVLFATGVIMLIIVLWTMRNKTTFLNKKSHTKLSTAEKKILLVFTVFTIFGAFTIGHESSTDATSDKFEAALEEYFECEAFGHIPGKCDRGTIEKIRRPYFSAIAYILMSLIPLSILNFILKWSSVKSARNKVVNLTKRCFSFLHRACESVPDELSSKSDKSTNSKNSAV
ncbi:PREDICTED: uncharacterized protein LOC109583831 [Amphimedon queenslandica]|uniref:Uncharacterized protein n=1 Tax=Amphimedon queenslandica TaxID=400682 RepID=A0AAN0JDQ7_AMPQE|nr:PREDICTED: uncharacterized protein LOC109583831 [Amphimedon queenslandica]|eukprot:XP_019854877.1 PREDICTED: uncharacterized protein LOC109583831 [Amphimedon queenslandica]